MDIATLIALLDGGITLVTKITAEIQKQKQAGVVLTAEQQAVLDRVSQIRTKVGL